MKLGGQRQSAFINIGACCVQRVVNSSSVTSLRFMCLVLFLFVSVSLWGSMWAGLAMQGKTWAGCQSIAGLTQRHVHTRIHTDG